jgi:hypothetical protein
MKRFFRIFDLSKNEQRVILIVILALVAITFVRYERRVRNRPPAQLTSTIESKASPTPVEIENEQ